MPSQALAFYYWNMTHVILGLGALSAMHVKESNLLCAEAIFPVRLNGRLDLYKIRWLNKETDLCSNKWVAEKK